MPEPSLLIVDDDHNLVDTMKAALESLGYAVTTAFNGADGVKQAQETHPSVIFLDFYMPSEGGDSAYERLRGSTDTAEIPVIFSSGAPIEEIRARLKTGPKTYFLRKPVSISQIQTVLSQVFGIQAPVPVRRSPKDVVGDEDSRPRKMPKEEKAAVPNKAVKERAIDPPPAPPQPPSQTSARTGVSRDVSGPPAPPTAVPEIAARKKPRPSAADAVAAFVKRMNERLHEFEIRVTYADTDKMGVIYYANYFKFFEMGRTELMRSLGVRYRDLETDRKLYLPVVETQCDYLGPSHYDDLLLVRTWLSRLGMVSVSFTYEIYDRDKGGRVVARGYTRHAVVGEDWRPAKIPPDMREILKKVLLPLRPS